jgi:excisionase family DNA binding protein
MDSNKGVLYPEDIAQATGLGLNLIYRLLRANKICHVKAGDRYLVSLTNYERWLSGAGQAPADTSNKT